MEQLSDGDMAEPATGSDQPAGEAEMAGRITIVGSRVRVDGFEVDDPALAELLLAAPHDQMVSRFEQLVALGAFGMGSVVTSSSLSSTLAEADDRFAATVDQALVALERTTQNALDRMLLAVDASLDPDSRNSVMARAVSELTDAQHRLIGELDLGRVDSTSAQLVAAIGAMVGPSGEMEQLLRQALDPTSGGSGLAEISSRLDERFGELRDLFMRAEGAHQEAAVGTAKGVRYEARVDECLRRIGRNIGGCIVMATGTDAGCLSTSDKTGDFVVQNTPGHTVVVEAKNKSKLALTGKSGILAELDRAMENRQAHVAICVSATDAFPQEVGTFGVYGNRILVVDDGDGVLLEAAVRLAFNTAAVTLSPRATVDAIALAEHIERITQQAARLSGIKRGLTAMKETLDRISGDVGAVQTELRGELERASMALDGGAPAQSGLRLVAPD